MSEDPFGTARLRDVVLAAWTASPDRFREDANAEEDLALGGYRDRLVVELAQNAADAAARAGRGGRLLLRLAESDGRALLVAANSGAPLDVAGVRALATLRASAKRDDDLRATVGRFGVGFAAVLAVTDEPTIVSHGRGVRFSRGDTWALVREAAAHSHGLAEELERRDGHVPVLRLPFPADGVAPDGYDTAVLLPLRDGAATDLVDRLLTDTDDALLLALPGLTEVVLERPGVPAVRLADVEQRWHGVRREGVFSAEQLADRPTEERRRPGWQVTWALPAGPSHVPRVLHAPTPTDEPLAWPALLVATFPLDVTRRHVAPGPATDGLVAEAAAAYADLLAERAEAGDDVLPIVPTGLPAGRLDADLRAATLALLPGVPFLRSVEDGALLRPRDAVALDGPAGADDAALAVLGTVLAGLVAAPRSATAALAAVGVQRLALDDVVEQLPPDASPDVWGRRYAGLASLADDPLVRESLAALPVPLIDGRVVRGARGACLLAGDVPVEHLAGLAGHGLRVVHPDAARDPAARRLLERLGAVPAGARQLLGDPAVAAAVDAVAEDPSEPQVTEVVEAVLTLVESAVASGELAAGDLPWLADLPLPADDGEPAAAGILVVPGSPAAEIFRPGDVLQVAASVLDRWGPDVLAVVGVTRTLGLVRCEDVDLFDVPDVLADLDGFDAWAAAVPDGTAAEVLAVRDLELVRDDAWERALGLLAADRDLREAVTSRVVVRTPEGSMRQASPYTAWWLRRRLVPAGLADPAADRALAGVLPVAPRWLVNADAAVRSALGLVRDWTDLDDAGWVAVLDRLGDPSVEVPLDGVLAAWRALALAASSGATVPVEPPSHVRGLTPDGLRVVDAADAVVVDAPMWLQRTEVGAFVLAPSRTAEALADVLDLDLARERAAGHVDRPARGGAERGGAERHRVPDAVRSLLPGAPESWREHETLRVDDVAVDWWVEGHGADAVVHAVTVAGLARGLAQAAGHWGDRLLVEALLVDPSATVGLLAEEALGEQD